jgi:hypothetical protein
MASLEGIRAPTRADSDAPAALTCLRARHRHWLWLRACEGPGVRLPFDLLSYCSGLLKRGAATTSAAATIPAADVQRAATGLDPCAVNGHRWQSPGRLLLPRRATRPPSKTEVAAARGDTLAASSGASARELIICLCGADRGIGSPQKSRLGHAFGPMHCSIEIFASTLAGGVLMDQCSPHTRVSYPGRQTPRI